MPEQITLRELLQDPIFKAWTRKVPELVPTPASSPPWILYVRMGSCWSSREYETYPLAFNTMAKLLKHRTLDDGAIHSKRQWFKPPIVRKEERRHYWPNPPGHLWCGYCRRPTVFACFSKHHAMNGKVFDPYEPRCTTCGFRRESLKLYPYSSRIRSRFA